MAFLDKTGLKQVWAGTLAKLNDKVDKTDYYGIVREEGGVVSAESLEGLAIGATTHIVPKQAGEGEVSPDNIRKITGWDVVTLHRTNENLISHFEARFTQGHTNAIVTPEYIDVVEPSQYDYQRYDNIRLKAGRTYTLVIDCETYGREEGNTKPMAVSWRIVAPGTKTNSATITANGKYRFTTKYTPETDTRVNITWNPNYGNTGDNRYRGCSRSSVMLLEGDYTTATAPAFIPCKKEVITTNLPETIYGGIYDWNTGLLIITHKKVSLTGEENWISNGGEILGQFYAEQLLLNNESMDSTKDGYCSHYQYGSAYQGTDKRVQGNGPHVWITDTSFTTVDELKAYLAAQVAAGTPVELVYPLATSYTIQLTPQQLIAIDGINFVRSDCGNTEASFNYTPFLNVVDNKVDKVEGMGLSTNDYTTAEKNKLRDIEEGANKTIIDSELSNDSINPVQNSTITTAIDGLNSLVGNIAVSTQISNAIADLINGAPTTLDTLGEIATAMEENADVVTALDTAIGTKANSSDLTSHINNESNPHNVTLNQLNVTATATELNFVSGTKSNIQTQFDQLSIGITDDEIDAICGATLDFDNTLIDEMTGITYTLYVSEGKLKMTEVTT